MPSALTLASMALASLVLAALTPVISCMRSCTVLAEYWANTATTINNSNMQPKPNANRVEMDRLWGADVTVLVPG